MQELYSSAKGLDNCFVLKPAFESLIPRLHEACAHGCFDSLREEQVRCPDGQPLPPAAWQHGRLLFQDFSVICVQVHIDG